MHPKTIVLTGASSGFGKLALEQLIENGHRVLAGLRGGEQRARTQHHSPKILKAIDSKQLIFVDLHMEKFDTFKNIQFIVEKEFGGRLDVLINNAGFGLLGPAELHTMEELRYQFEVNFFGLIGLTQEILPFLKKAQGKIITVGSVVGRTAFPYYGAYAATKHALEGYLESLHSELKSHGVQVSLIEPGGFKTDFMAKRNLSNASQASRDPSNPYHEKLKKFDQTILNQRSALLGNPKRVSNLMVRLVEKEKTGFRYLIGLDAHAMIFLKWLLPDSILLWMKELFFRPFLLGSKPSE